MANAGRPRRQRGFIEGLPRATRPLSPSGRGSWRPSRRAVRTASWSPARSAAPTVTRRSPRHERPHRQPGSRRDVRAERRHGDGRSWRSRRPAWRTRSSSPATTARARRWRASSPATSTSRSCSLAAVRHRGGSTRRWRLVNGEQPGTLVVNLIAIDNEIATGILDGSVEPPEGVDVLERLQLAESGCE